MTVICVISLIAGLNKVVKSSFSAIGSDILYVQKYPWMMDSGDWWSFRGRKSITVEDAEAIERLCPSIKAVAPNLGRHRQAQRKIRKSSRNPGCNSSTAKHQWSFC
jgi:putative ABC transport system permease protein